MSQLSESGPTLAQEIPYKYGISQDNYVYNNLNLRSSEFALIDPYRYWRWSNFPWDYSTPPLWIVNVLTLFNRL